MTVENKTTTISEKVTSDQRLSADTKVIKCAFCDALEQLKPFNQSYVCEACISYICQTENNS
jgi:hypothetical protein